MGIPVNGEEGKQRMVMLSSELFTFKGLNNGVGRILQDCL